MTVEVIILNETGKYYAVMEIHGPRTPNVDHGWAVRKDEADPPGFDTPEEAKAWALEYPGAGQRHEVDLLIVKSGLMGLMNFLHSRKSMPSRNANLPYGKDPV